MSELGALLCVCAHQDDEWGIAARIARECRGGRRVVCAFLTDGAASVPSAVRDAESRAVLLDAGVRADDILFLGSRHGIPDGSLVEHLDAAYLRLAAAVQGVPVAEVVTLAWEGGHHDHDAAHLVAVALAAHLRVRCREYPLYRGAWPGFRVLSPLRAGGVVTRLGVREALRAWSLVWRYRSQRRTWLALAGEAFWRLVVLRREVLHDTDAERLRHPPHARPLYYERRFRYPWERFAACAAPFVVARLGSGGDGAGDHDQGIRP
jgi:LmbE family N-acetylglucosaminyl deacetylase